MSRPTKNHLATVRTSLPRKPAPDPGKAAQRGRPELDRRKKKPQEGGGNLAPGYGNNFREEKIERRIPAIVRLIPERRETSHLRRVALA